MICRSSLKVTCFGVILLILLASQSLSIINTPQSIEIIKANSEPYNLICPNKNVYPLSYDYVVICEEQYENKAVEFANWKSSNSNFNTIVATVEDICNNPDYWVMGMWGDGNPSNPFYISQSISNPERYNDSQCHIRNYIRYMVYENNLKYVLLYGYNVPAREITYDYETWSEVQPADTLWYGCLYGTQNSDDDQDSWGKFTDDMQGSDFNHCYLTDLTMDVIVGRIHAENNNEFDNILTKTQVYRSSSNTRIWAKTISLFDDIYGGSNNTNLWDELNNTILGDYDKNKLYDFVTNSNNYNLMPKSWRKYLDDFSNGTVDYPEGYSMYVSIIHGDRGFTDGLVFGNSNNPFFHYSGSCTAGVWDSVKKGPYYMRHDIGGPCLMIGDVFSAPQTHWLFTDFYIELMEEKKSIGDAFKDHWNSCLSNVLFRGCLGFGILGDPSLCFKYLENPVAKDISNIQDYDDYGVTLSARVYDFQDDAISITFRTNCSGYWQDLKCWNNVDSNTTLEHYTKIFGPRSGKYFWSINCTDGKSWMNFTRSSTVRNVLPLIDNEFPESNMEDIDPYISEVSVDISDVEGDTLYWSISTVPDVGSNSGVIESNGRITCPISDLNYYSSYRWDVSIFDGFDWGNVSYYFKTKKIDTSVNPIRPYNVISYPFELTCNGDLKLDNVTLFYRYSSDNISWKKDTYLDQKNINGDSSDLLSRSNLAQSFIPGYNGDLEYIHLLLRNNGGSSDDILVRIMEEKPYKNCVIASTVIPGFSDTDYIWRNASFDNPPTLTNDKIYFIVVSQMSSSSDYHWQMDTNNNYNYGSAWCKSPEGWLDYKTKDFVFKTYMTSSWRKWDKSAENPDTNSNNGWSWHFDFPESSGYYEFYSIGRKTNSLDEINHGIADARCNFIGGSQIGFYCETPANRSIDVGLTPTVSIKVIVPEDESFICTFSTSDDGINWIQRTSFSISETSTLEYDYVQADQYKKMYNWMVTADNETEEINSDVFWFKTISGDPVVDNEQPENNSINVPISLANLNLEISDPQGDIMDWSIKTSPDIGSNSGSSYDTFISCPVSNLDYLTSYIWYVNITDRTHWTNKTYSFTTHDNVNMYSLSIEIVGNGTVDINPNCTLYPQGSNVTLTALSNPGWSFDHWSNNVDDPNSATTNVSMNSDKSVTAYFVEDGPNYYSLSTSTQGSGSISLNPSGGTYSEGTVVTVTANADSDWVFDHWEGDLSGSSNPSSITMTSDKSINAVFIENQHGVSISYEIFNMKELSVNIENLESNSLSNLEYSIDISGGIISGIDVFTEGVIDYLDVGSMVMVESDEFGFGLGTVDITVVVSVDGEIFTREAEGLVIGSVLLIF